MDPAYPAARAVAGRVHDYFRRQIDRVRLEDVGRVAPQATEQTIEALIDTAFWASLRREEGYPPKISMAFVPPVESDVGLLLERPLPVVPDVLTQLAPAVERPGIHLGVWQGTDGLWVWGATRALPPLCLVLEVVAPGVIVIKHQRKDDSGKFINVVVLEGDRVKIIEQHNAETPDCPRLVASLLGFRSSAFWNAPTDALVELALSMRAHGRGGTLLVVQHGTDDWLKSIVVPVTYAVAPPFARLSDLMRQNADERSDRQWGDAFRRVIEGIAGLTAVDGATILSDRYEVLGFGAKIVLRSGSGRAERILLTEPVEKAKPAIVDVTQLGGTRHLSAAQFVYDQHGAVALVASQDGQFTVFEWSSQAGLVHAHRVEALLL